MTILFKRAAWVALAFSSITILPSVVVAETCKNVDIVLENNSDRQVKALFANFKCEGENERKEMFNNTEVPAGTTLPVATQQNLQGCKGKKMEYVEVHYKTRCDSNGWSKEKFIKDKTFLNAFCKSDAGKSYKVVLPTDDPQVQVGC